jgi:hypothetical protein
MFDKNALFAALKPQTKPVAIPGFGELTAKQLSVSEVNEVREILKKNDKQEDAFGLQLVMMSMVDSDGQRVFEEEDLAQLQAASNAAVDTLIAATLELNGFKKAVDAGN